METFFVTFAIAIQTIFAGAFSMLSPEHQQYVQDNIAGVWVIEPGDTGWPQYYGAYAYMNAIGGHTLYIGAENLPNTYANAWKLCHEAAHGAGHGHDAFLWQLEDDCKKDVERYYDALKSE